MPKTQKYYRILFHAQNHYVKEIGADKTYIKGITVTFSTLRKNDVSIHSENWFDKDLQKKIIIEITKEEYESKFNEAIEILKQKINAK